MKTESEIDVTNQTELDIVAKIARTRSDLVEVAKEILKLHETKEYKLTVEGAFSFEITIKVT